MSTTPIQLNFINRTNDQTNHDVVIFQKNTVTSISEAPIAWTVIENGPQDCQYSFTYTQQLTVAVIDADRKTIARTVAEEGQRFDVTNSIAGEVMATSPQGAVSKANIAIKNMMEKGAISAEIFRDGKLLARQSHIFPGQHAVFSFNSRIHIGIVPQVVEGKMLDPASIANIDGEIDLSNITSADIVMTGGGSGADATPFQFMLENANY